jgi:hypothetical protein
MLNNMYIGLKENLISVLRYDDCEISLLVLLKWKAERSEQKRWKKNKKH